MGKTFEIQGRSWQAQQIEEIGKWVRDNPHWSRYRLSRELCTRWGWIRPNGQLADMAARSFLGKLDERGLIQLPPCRRESPNRMKHRRLECVRLESSRVETFVDRSRFHGGAYAASNWVEVGLTQGRSRGDAERQIQVPKKAVYVYPLSGQARQRLCR